MLKEGKVKWFNNAKGYGFINTETKEEGDIFVHFSQILQEGYKSLKEGDPVEFELEYADKGIQAHNVKPKEQKEEEDK